MKSYKITQHVVGSPNMYWALKLLRNGEVVNVHTSKNKTCVMAIAKNWMKYK